jgi:hypothetical protein
VPLSLVGDGLIDLLRYLGPLVLAVEDLVIAILPLIGDAGEMLGALGELLLAIDEVLALLGLAVAFEGWLLFGGSIVNHIFTQDKLRGALLGFRAEALGESRSIVRAWREHPAPRPALYMSGTDLKGIGYQLDARHDGGRRRAGTVVRVDSLGSGRLQLSGLVLHQVSGVAGQRALVAGKVARQCLKRQGGRLPRPSSVHQGQRQEGPDRIVQVVRPGVQLCGEQRDALLRLAEVSQRAGQLDHRPASALAGQPPLQRLPVQRHGEVSVAGGVQRGRPLEQPDPAVGG